MPERNIVETLKPDELPDYLKYCESMLRDYDGEDKKVRETLRTQIRLTKDAIRRTQAGTRGTQRTV